LQTKDARANPKPVRYISHDGVQHFPLPLEMFFKFKKGKRKRNTSEQFKVSTFLTESYSKLKILDISYGVSFWSFGFFCLG
jgi:hypothetical protein